MIQMISTKPPFEDKRNTGQIFFKCAGKHQRTNNATRGARVHRKKETLRDADAAFPCILLIGEMTERHISWATFWELHRARKAKLEEKNMYPKPDNLVCGLIHTYSHAPHKDKLVKYRLHIKGWSHKIIKELKDFYHLVIL